MNDRQQFYQIRDQRTVEYGISSVFDEAVGVYVGEDAARSVDGQCAVLALVNMIARIHRTLFLHIPQSPLLCQSSTSDRTLDEAARSLAQSVDPFIQFPTEHGSRGIALGLGVEAPSGLPWYIGSDGQIATVDRSPLPLGKSEAGMSLGAALAACLGAANLLRQLLSHDIRPARISAWNIREGDLADQGPQLSGSLNVGDIMLVGAGGVGSCLAYWINQFGYVGQWLVIDGDEAELNDTNRCLGILPVDCGWPAGPALNKAKIAAGLIGATPLDTWYDSTNLDAFVPDLVIPLANERGVRRHIAARGEPVLLHATTSRTWEAQFHRHVPDRDDCIVCRMPAKHEDVKFPCSTVEIAGRRGAASSDAALPFLSATSALLLLSGLFRLQAGDLLDKKHNFEAVCFNDARRAVRRAICSCKSGCVSGVPLQARRKIHAGRRWCIADR